MRQIGSLSSKSQAQLLADYLITQHIATRLDQEGETWAIWVCEEDQVDRARQILAEFQQAPNDLRYSAAVRTARSLRQQEDRQEEEYRQKQIALREKLTEPPPSSRGVTVLLVAASLTITFVTQFGNYRHVPHLVGLFTITDVAAVNPPSLGQELARGEVWRLVTPIFLHFSTLHLIFNLLWLMSLGSMIEQSRGPWRYLGLVLLLAVPSNLGQYYLGNFHVDGLEVILILNPLFGGMSGVVYGLLGYCWMKARYEPQLGLMVSSQTVLIMLVWYVLCLVDAVGHVANMAHTVGLLVGLVAGRLPTWGAGRAS